MADKTPRLMYWQDLTNKNIQIAKVKIIILFACAENSETFSTRLKKFLFGFGGSSLRG